jgi:hypothetical protein
MVNWRKKALGKVHLHVREQRVLFTLKALRELEALELGLDQDDVCRILEDLDETDLSQRIAFELTHEWLYIFKTSVAEIELYLKVAIRHSCVLISFHEDESNER